MKGIATGCGDDSVIVLEKSGRMIPENLTFEPLDQPRDLAAGKSLISSDVRIDGIPYIFSAYVHLKAKQYSELALLCCEWRGEKRWQERRISHHSSVSLD
jgi:hypothetical protein